MSFQLEINKTAEEFKKLINEPIGIMSHSDTDGITSAAIISKALQRLGVSFQIQFITRTGEDILNIIKQKKYKVFFLLDYGAKEINNIAKENPDKKFFVLDHHPPAETKLEQSNVFNPNPQYFGIDGGRDICGSTICYLFAKALDEKNKDLSALAIVGAVGDSQRKEGKFTGPNQEIFEQALKDGFIVTEKGLRFYGWSSRPLHKALSYSTDPFVPEISGSESAAVQFIKELGIELKKEDGTWKTIRDLTEDETKKLATALIAQRQSVKDPANIFEEKIILAKFNIEPLKEAETLSAVLNSCAKLEHFGIALGVAMGNKSDYEKSKEIANEYKKQLIKGMNYFYDNRSNPQVVKETDNTIYFFGKDQVDGNLIGTVVTILSSNLESKVHKIIIGFGEKGGTLKISARFIGKKKENIDLGKLCSEIAEKLGGEGGGHAVAAGASIPLGKEEMFINAFEERVNNG